MSWSGLVLAEWLEDGRSMRLLEPLTYEGNDGTIWRAFKGEVVDGASIPRFFWRFIGGPFTGKYRRASVIHDVYCSHKTLDSRRVHAGFYEMMRSDGVPAAKAYAMWAAVRVFGPRFKGMSHADS